MALMTELVGGANRVAFVEGTKQRKKERKKEMVEIYFGMEWNECCFYFGLDEVGVDRKVREDSLP